MCRSPLALRSMREWRAKSSSMWSRKPIPVEIDATPAPSRSIATSTSVSLVLRLTEPLRMNGTFALSRAPCIRARLPSPLWRPPQLHPYPTRLKSLRATDRCMQPTASDPWHATTILTVRKGGSVVIGGDGQVSIGQTIVKANAKKVRRLGKGDVIGGFGGAPPDAFTLFERLEAKLDQYPGQLTRA